MPGVEEKMKWKCTLLHQLSVPQSAGEEGRLFSPVDTALILQLTAQADERSSVELMQMFFRFWNTARPLEWELLRLLASSDLRGWTSLTQSSTLNLILYYSWGYLGLFVFGSFFSKRKNKVWEFICLFWILGINYWKLLKSVKYEYVTMNMNI